MTEQSRNILKQINESFFNSHIDEIIWSKENRKCVIKMDTKNVDKQKEEFIFEGEDAIMIFKKLTY
jgi:hypothetical protein